MVPKFVPMLRNSFSNSTKTTPTIPTLIQSNKFKRRIKPTIQKAHYKTKRSSQTTLTFWVKCNFFLYSASNTQLTKVLLISGIPSSITKKTTILRLRFASVQERTPSKIAMIQRKKSRSCLLL